MLRRPAACIHEKISTSKQTGNKGSEREEEYLSLSLTLLSQSTLVLCGVHSTIQPSENPTH